jgi:UDP-glucose 4-epimerase
MTKPLIALTGGTGFIGRHLLRELPRRGYRVRALLRRPAALPVECPSAIIGDLAQPRNMASALADADMVIHSAGLARAMSGVPEDDYRVFNTEATIGLARAAQRAGVSRFIFLSSIRAQSGPTAPEILTEDMEPRPTDAYGRSKLAAEQGLAGLGLDWVALRPVLVYGPGVTGNMARLIRLARTPWPLPLGALTARRSLVSLETLTAAITSVLEAREDLRRSLIVADPDPLTAAEMIAALRRGLGRRPGVIRFPQRLLATIAKAASESHSLEVLANPLVVDTTALSRLGWSAPATSAVALERLMRDTSQADLAARPGGLSGC